MTGTDLCVNKPHCAAAVRPSESEATTSTLSPARVRTCSVLSGSCQSDEQLWLQKKISPGHIWTTLYLGMCRAWMPALKGYTGQELFHPWYFKRWHTLGEHSAAPFRSFTHLLAPPAVHFILHPWLVQSAGECFVSVGEKFVLAVVNISSFISWWILFFWEYDISPSIIYSTPPPTHPDQKSYISNLVFYILFTHQQMHFLLNLEKFKFTWKYT
jgi:hypothetical protein